MAQIRTSPHVEVRLPPARTELAGTTSIFLAGTTTATGTDWRENLIKAVKENAQGDMKIVFLNPKRDDWDSTWREDFSDERWVEQVQWELDMQDAADIVVVAFHGVSLAPISLLELGLCARSGKAIVCAVPEYAKRGNVEAVCRKYGATFVNTVEELQASVLARLSQISSS